MKQFGRLLYYEWKKIWKRKGTWITLGILILFYLVMDGTFFFGSTYVDGEFLETHIEGRKTDLEHGRRLSGRKIDDALLQEMRESYESVNHEKHKSDKKYQLTEEYQKKIRPYRMLNWVIESFFEGASKYGGKEITEAEIYRAREETVRKAWDKYHLSDSERSYWEKKEGRLSIPVTYQYAESYEYMIDMSGTYRVCMLVTFLLAVCMSGVFTEEHSRRMDQMILCSRLGRSQMYFAKIAAGSLFSVFTAVLLTLCMVSGAFLMYGADGFSAAIQLIVPYYSEAMTAGQVLLIMTGLLLLASVMSAVFIMVLSELTCSSIASMAAAIALMFLSRLIPIPYAYRVFSQIWNWMPMNLLKYDAGFFDLRLVPVFGARLTSWQAAPICYIVFTTIFVLIGMKV